VRGAAASRVRRMFPGIGLAGCTLLLPACLVRNDRLSMGLLICACLSSGLWSSNVWAMTQRLAGTAGAAKWTGVQNGFGNLAGVVAPWLTGWLVGQTGHFLYAFISVTVVLLVGSAAYLVLIGPIEPIVWTRSCNLPGNYSTS